MRSPACHQNRFTAHLSLMTRCQTQVQTATRDTSRNRPAQAEPPQGRNLLNSLACLHKARIKAAPHGSCFFSATEQSLLRQPLQPSQALFRAAAWVVLQANVSSVGLLVPSGHATRMQGASAANKMILAASVRAHVGEAETAVGSLLPACKGLQDAHESHESHEIDQ